MRTLVILAVVAVVWAVLLVALHVTDSDDDPPPRVVAREVIHKIPAPTTTQPPTTTTARARTAPTLRTASVSRPVAAGEIPAGHEPGTINGYPCGGTDLPRCSTFRRESGGNPTAYNPTGCGGRSCGGIAQFDPVTFIPGCTVKLWNAGKCGTYQGYRYAHEAPVDVQYARIREIYAGGAGCFHWGRDECVGLR